MFIVKKIITILSGVSVFFATILEQLDLGNHPLLTPWGFKLSGQKDMAQGKFEPLETKIIEHLLNKVNIFINIGANVGYYCCHALNKNKQVIAFEPIERNLRYLYKNLEINGWSDTEVFPIALSNHVGLIKIYGSYTGASLVNGWAGTPENYVRLVPSSTMDLVLSDRFREEKILILIDVEGAERWVLEGSKILLGNIPKPIWVVEIGTTQHYPENIKINPNLNETFQIFFDNGYQALICNNNLESITMEDVKLVSQGKKHFSGHNFIFCSMEDVLYIRELLKSNS